MTDERWREISRVYHDAVELEPALRAAFLRDACGDDDSLRTQVELLLGAEASPDAQWLESARGDLLGRRFGVYEIRSMIGAGGMGEVYRAHDSTLGRDVAVKVLPRMFTADPERRARFAREARHLAALNHPNIGAIYGVEESDGIQALILELVEGPTLLDRLVSAPIPVAEALQIARQIAAALGAAHERKIIHRDLKPANIKITSGGVKVLDFGLAKTQSDDDRSSHRTHARTSTSGTTREGVMLGTAAYTSPEQARGQPVDTRTDVWAFGCVLYEMLSGHPAFARATLLDTVAAVLEHEPDWTALPKGLPRSIRHALQRCLDKDRQTRAPDLAVMRAALDRATVRSATATKRWMAAAVLAGVVTSTTAWFYYRDQARRRAEETITEAIRLADQDNYGASLARVQYAAHIIPGDSRISSLLRQISVVRPIMTTPPGADVYFKPWEDSSDHWEIVGQTPIAEARLPRGVFRWRIQKPGYHTLEFVAENHRIPREGETSNMTSYSALNEHSIELQTSAATPMVTVPAGTLSLRQQLRNYDSPTIRAGAYRIGQYEVTNAEFKRFMDAGGYAKREFWTEEFVLDGRTISWEVAITRFTDRTGRRGPAGWEAGTYPAGQENYPVGGVSWYEAAAYAKYVRKSLPTVYHWVKAAAPRIATYITPFSNVASKGVTVAGGRSGVSPFGAYDMAGNMREWCWNEMTPRQSRYAMGGAWTEPAYNVQNGASRSPFDRSEGNGFRVAEYLDAGPLPDILTGPVPPPARDYSKEQPVSDDVFSAYLNFFAVDPTPLDAKVESIDTSAEGWIKETVSFAAGYGQERVPAVLFLPRNVRPPYQTVVYFPGADAGIARSNDAVEIETFDFVILTGRAVLAPIYQGMYERNKQVVGTPVVGTSRNLANLIVQRNTDLRQAVDYLESRPDIDKTALGYFGFSGGAAIGPIALALEPRFRVGLFLIGGFQPYSFPPQVDPLNFTPRVKVPVLMLNGDSDTTFPVTVQKRMFTLLGTADRDKRHVVYPGGHGVFGIRRSEMIREMLEWLDRYLGPVNRP